MSCFVFCCFLYVVVCRSLFDVHVLVVIRCLMFLVVGVCLLFIVCCSLFFFSFVVFCLRCLFFVFCLLIVDC